MEAGAPMEEEHFQVKILLKLIEVELMLQDGLQNLWFLMDYVIELWYK